MLSSAEKSLAGVLTRGCRGGKAPRKTDTYCHGHGNLNMAKKSSKQRKKGQFFRYCALIAFEDQLQCNRRVDNSHTFGLLHVGGIMHVNGRSGRRWVQNTRLTAPLGVMGACKHRKVPTQINVIVR